MAFWGWVWPSSAPAAPAPDPAPTPASVTVGGMTAVPLAETKPRLSLKAGRGFYDDAWALDPTGKQLALVETDADSFQELRVLDLDADPGKPGKVFELPHPPRELEGLSFLPVNSGFLLVTAAIQSAATAGHRTGAGTEAGTDGHLLESFDGSGHLLGKAGPVSAFGVASRSAGPVLVTLDRRSDKAANLVYVVSSLKVPTLKSAGPARRYVVGGDGLLRTPSLAPAGFLEGYSKLLTTRPGSYDRKKDVRQPDSQSVLDLLSGKPISDAPIEDVYGWARTTRARREHPNRTAFIQLSDTGIGDPGAIAVGAGSPKPARAGVELLDPAGRLAIVSLAVPFRIYDRFTLKDQEGPTPGLVHFGIQVDPVNPDAVARQKADKPFLDIYTVPTGRPDACKHRARVALDSQPVVWAVAGDRLVVFRRFKSFARGGDRIDVYDLAPPP